MPVIAVEVDASVDDSLVDIEVAEAAGKVQGSLLVFGLNIQLHIRVADEQGYAVQVPTEYGVMQC